MKTHLEVITRHVLLDKSTIIILTKIIRIREYCLGALLWQGSLSPIGVALYCSLFLFPVPPRLYLWMPEAYVYCVLFITVRPDVLSFGMKSMLNAVYTPKLFMPSQLHVMSLAYRLSNVRRSLRKSNLPCILLTT
jgi:hypothetical protein